MSRPPTQAVTRALLLPLQALYAAAVHSKNARYDKGPSCRLEWPVVSVGNLSMGGAGKTPVVIRLAQLLAQAGWGVDVLSRGYGRGGSGAERIDLSLPAAQAAERFGDEPVMIAHSAQVPVYVGNARYAAGRLAEQELPAGARRVHLLDDGFQHRQLARTVDIVVVHRDDVTDRLLPSGRLREPLASLRRASIVVLRDADSALAESLQPYLKPGAALWTVHRRLSAPQEKRRALAFCAIARPQEFFQALESTGMELVGRMRFRDHHGYGVRDMERIARAGKRYACEEFVTTEKDAVKLGPELRAKLAETAPLRPVRLIVEFENESSALDRLIAMLYSKAQTL